MSTVKSPTGSLRAERAAVTRRRIADAARHLFATHGYGATTLREVAETAGVAVQTVFAVFGSKANILRELRERVADDPAADTAYAQALIAPDRHQAIDLFARSIRLRWEHGHDIVLIGAEAATVDPSIRAEAESMLMRRRKGIAMLARTLVTGVGRDDVDDLVAIIDAVTLPALYAELVDVHSWSPDAYESWLVAILRMSVEGRLIGDLAVGHRDQDTTG